MLTRRQFGYCPALIGLVETAFAQHAAVQGAAPPGTVWLNANENPEGPPEAVKEALRQAVGEAGRYSHRVFPGVVEAIARHMGVHPAQVILGAGSTEVLHCALDAFTGPGRPLITAWPTWEMTRDITLAAGKPVVQIPLLTKDWSSDVEAMVVAARKAGGGLIHFGNPNNPTSSITSAEQVRWIARNLPANTVLVIDEAYIEFTDPAAGLSAIGLIREGVPNVVVTRTFSKLYGMAGVRVGFGCAPAELIQKMQVFRNNVISVLGARAAMAAIAEGTPLVSARRERRNRIRAEFCSWLRDNGFNCIPPNANFVLIDVAPRDVRDIVPRMLAAGVATGRRFEAVPNRLRIAIGTEAEMDKFKSAFRKVMAG